MVEQTKVRMTAAEFFQLPETTEPIELIDGELIVSPTPIPKHQRVSGRSFILLEKLIPNGELFYAPMEVYFDDENIPQPDILWIAANSRCVVGEKRLEGPPDLIVEIFSPSTTKRDRREKFNLYERFGVREYWMVDPVGQYVEVYTLADNHYGKLGLYGPGETFTSPVLDNKTVDVSAIFSS
jgi:Uma2 family endonuclease